MTEVYASARSAIFPGGSPVEGVAVRLYDSLGAFVTSATTGADGLAYLGNRPAGSYELRISAPAPSTVTAGTRQSITVPDSPDDTAFDVVVQTAALPSSADILLCTCSGYFVDTHGEPLAGVTLIFSESATTPALLHYSGTNVTHGVIPINHYVTTDNLGYAQVNLIRGIEYSMILQGYETYPRKILVPDLAAASLPDVVFPSVHRVEWLSSGSVIAPTTAPAVTLAVDEVKSLTVQTVFRSGVIATGLKDVTLAVADTAVVSLTLGADGAATLVGNSAGTTTIEVTRVTPSEGLGVTVRPEPAVVGTLSVTVTS